MTPHDQDQLLHELLLGKEISDFRRASLEKGIASIRSQGRRCCLMRVAAVTSLVVPFLAAILWIELSSRTQTEKSVEVRQKPAAAQVETKIITDEELFSLFPGRSMALIGKRGEQELVFFNQQTSESSEVH